VFRACVLAVYALGGAARWKMISFAPLVFGLGAFCSCPLRVFAYFVSGGINGMQESPQVRWHCGWVCFSTLDSTPAYGLGWAERTRGVC
jgi:hypothetical protein